MTKMTKVELVYRSGLVKVVKVKDLTVHKVEGKLARIEWTDMKPRPLFLGIDDIVAVFER